MRSLAYRSVFFIGLLTLGCGGVADIGEPCDGVGSTKDCVSGAICTDDGRDGVGAGTTCRRICEDDTICGASESCLPVDNTDINTKSCQPK